MSRHGLDADRVRGAEAAALFEPVVEILRVATAAKLALASRLESSGIWRERGYPNAAAMVAATEGIGLRAAASTLADAERLRSCPATGDALRSGKVSEAQARAITGAAVTSPGRDVELLQAAADDPADRRAPPRSGVLRRRPAMRPIGGSMPGVICATGATRRAPSA